MEQEYIIVSHTLPIGVETNKLINRLCKRDPILFTETKLQFYMLYEYLNFRMITMMHHTAAILVYQ